MYIVQSTVHAWDVLDNFAAKDWKCDGDGKSGTGTKNTYII